MERTVRVSSFLTCFEKTDTNVAAEIVGMFTAEGLTSWPNSERTCRSQVSGLNEINGRHEETRTPDLYRVKVALYTTELRAY